MHRRRRHTRAQWWRRYLDIDSAAAATVRPCSSADTPQPDLPRQWSLKVQSGLLGSCDAFNSSTLAQEATYSGVNNVPGAQQLTAGAGLDRA